MSIFRLSKMENEKPESPALLFRDLKKDPSIKFLWAHQEKLLDKYLAEYEGSADLAIELPTGTGKTLVGLLIGDFRRRKNDERIAFFAQRFNFVTK